jgi:hypothetical protein
MGLTLSNGGCVIVIGHHAKRVKFTELCCCKCEGNGNIIAASTGKIIQEAEPVRPTTKRFSHDHPFRSDAIPPPDTPRSGPRSLQHQRSQPMKGRDRRRTGEPAEDLLGTALLACLVAALLASSVAVVSAARAIDIAPKVGDILAFRVGAQVPTVWDFPAVTISDQLPVSCNLRPDVMVAAGGSLVVEERFENRRMYRVHWAGQHTANGEYDCGSTADLLVSRGDLQLLTNAVGGVGVQRGPSAGY